MHLLLAAAVARRLARVYSKAWQSQLQLLHAATCSHQSEQDSLSICNRQDPLSIIMDFAANDAASDDHSRADTLHSPDEDIPILVYRRVQLESYACPMSLASPHGMSCKWVQTSHRCSIGLCIGCDICVDLGMVEHGMPTIQWL